MLTEILLILILALCLTAVILLLVSAAAGKRREEMIREALDEALRDRVDEMGDDITDRMADRFSDIQEEIRKRMASDSEENRRDRQELSGLIKSAGREQRMEFDRFTERQREYLRESIRDLQETNREKLGEIQADINEKLKTSLSERLDEAFHTVGDQLSQLYKSLGELGKLEDGVSSLNRTLSNVKTRGILGEAQLENILASILAPSLYDKNVITKKGGSEPVEFAVKIPDKETPGAFLYLPIDSKFPATIYDKICEASDSCDAEGLSRAQKELEQRIRTEAKSIFEKYVEPPHTTDFAVMFLPTEALYAEVLRIPELTEICQRKYHIVITGPATVAALLNSLSVGFRYMAVNRDSQNILRLLSAIKTQYASLSELIDTAGKRLDSARKATSDLKRRTEIINRRLASVEEIDSKEAGHLLGTDEGGIFPGNMI
ncbi:MAG: DNA recombination protein RmuC [Eubacteriales bacterium]|nr:DNA recombination protein RmuC [Eubacteriales bacterium]